jgi:hypothetical protein
MVTNQQIGCPQNDEQSCLYRDGRIAQWALIGGRRFRQGLHTCAVNASTLMSDEWQPMSAWLGAHHEIQMTG